jgi:hypothetical protein
MGIACPGQRPPMNDAPRDVLLGRHDFDRAIQ